MPVGKGANRGPFHSKVAFLELDGTTELCDAYDFPFRLYTAAQFRRLLTSAPAFELCDVYDFWYEIDRPMKLSNELGDAVFILRRR